MMLIEVKQHDQVQALFKFKLFKFRIYTSDIFFWRVLAPHVIFIDYDNTRIVFVFFFTLMFIINLWELSLGIILPILQSSLSSNSPHWSGFQKNSTISLISRCTGFFPLYFNITNIRMYLDNRFLRILNLIANIVWLVLKAWPLTNVGKISLTSSL